MKGIIHELVLPLASCFSLNMAISHSASWSRIPSLAWVQRTQAGLRPNPHVSWPSGLRLSAKSILQCAASLAAGGYDRPCGPIESLFLLSPARILDGRARLYSPELS